MLSDAPQVCPLGLPLMLRPLMHCPLSFPFFKCLRLFVPYRAASGTLCLLLSHGAGAPAVGKVCRGAAGGWVPAAPTAADQDPHLYDMSAPGSPKAISRDAHELIP